MSEPILRIQSLSVTAQSKKLLGDVSLDIPAGGVFGIIGPSGAGKSTLLKSINRLTELNRGLRVSGEVIFKGESVYSAQADPDLLRGRIGILFQQPAVFPMSIRKNVLFAVKHLGLRPRSEFPEILEKSLRQVALWDEVKDRLKKPALQLSVGQQQRLCLARTLATEPEMILMDEPTSALDPKSTEAIEGLIKELSKSYTVVIVTHNMQQAQRLCENVAFIGVKDGAGALLAQGNMETLQTREDVPELQDYLRF